MFELTERVVKDTKVIYKKQYQAVEILNGLLICAPVRQVPDHTYGPYILECDTSDLAQNFLGPVLHYRCSTEYWPKKLVERYIESLIIKLL